MALETRLSAKLSGQSKDIFRKKVGPRERVAVKASSGGNTIFITALVTRKGETAGTPEVDLAAKGEPIAGVIVGEAWAAVDLSKDSDSPYTDGTFLLMERLYRGDQVWLTAKTNSAITSGATVQCDGGFIINFAYTDAAAATDLLGGVIGNAMIGCTATADTEKLCLIEVGIPGGV
jgi:hypothetical protein